MASNPPGRPGGIDPNAPVCISPVEDTVPVAADAQMSTPDDPSAASTYSEGGPPAVAPAPWPSVVGIFAPDGLDDDPLRDPLKPDIRHYQITQSIRPEDKIFLRPLDSVNLETDLELYLTQLNQRTDLDQRVAFRLLATTYAHLGAVVWVKGVYRIAAAYYTQAASYYDLIGEKKQQRQALFDQGKVSILAALSIKHEISIRRDSIRDSIRDAKQVFLEIQEGSEVGSLDERLATIWLKFCEAVAILIHPTTDVTRLRAQLTLIGKNFLETTGDDKHLRLEIGATALTALNLIQSLLGFTELTPASRESLYETFFVQRLEVVGGMMRIATDQRHRNYLQTNTEEAYADTVNFLLRRAEGNGRDPSYINKAQGIVDRFGDVVQEGLRKNSQKLVDVAYLRHIVLPELRKALRDRNLDALSRLMDGKYLHAIEHFVRIELPITLQRIVYTSNFSPDAVEFVHKVLQMIADKLPPQSSPTRLSLAQTAEWLAATLASIQQSSVWDEDMDRLWALVAQLYTAGATHDAVRIAYHKDPNNSLRGILGSVADIISGGRIDSEALESLVSSLFADRGHSSSGPVNIPLALGSALSVLWARREPEIGIEHVAQAAFLAAMSARHPEIAVVLGDPANGAFVGEFFAAGDLHTAVELFNTRIGDVLEQFGLAIRAPDVLKASGEINQGVRAQISRAQRVRVLTR